MNNNNIGCNPYLPVYRGDIAPHHFTDDMDAILKRAAWSVGFLESWEPNPAVCWYFGEDMMLVDCNDGTWALLKDDAVAATGHDSKLWDDLGNINECSVTVSELTRRITKYFTILAEQPDFVLSLSSFALLD